MLKTKTWIIIIGILLALSAAAATFLLTHKSDGTVVQILQDGVCIQEIDLDAVKEAYSFTIEAENGGNNTILVEPGRIRISEADCPDQICVQHGWLPDSSAPIICLPHRLVLKLAGEGKLDSVAE